MGRITSAAWPTLLARERITGDIPGRPVEYRRQRNRPVVPGEAKIAIIVHLGGIDDFAWVEEVFRIEELFDVTEGIVECGAELPRHPFAPAQAVAMLARIGSFVLTYKGRRLFGNLAHLACSITPHVENRPHVQSADTGVGVPGALGTMTMEHLGELV